MESVNDHTRLIEEVFELFFALRSNVDEVILVSLIYFYI